MKRSALLVLSSLLLNTASYAGNTKCDDCHDPFTKNAAALHYTVSKPNSPETKYWEDYIHSGQKDITVYVRDLSRKDAQAALWFITTGGKHGFAARQATEYERGLLEDAIKQVAISYSQQGVKSGRGLQEWSQVSNANHAGHLHLQMIYKQIDDLNSKVNNLESEVKLLRAAQEASNKKYDKIYEELKAESKERTTSLPFLLQTQTEGIKAIFEKSEKEWEAMMAKWDANIEKDRLERENLRLAAAAEKTNYENKLAAQKLADKTVADAEKATLTALIAQNQKDAENKLAAQKKEAEDKEKKLKDDAEAEKAAIIKKKKDYKKELAEYKVKEAAAEKAKAVADALKEKEEEMRKEREAAAKAMKEQQEAAAKEREAAAKAMKEQQEAAALKERQREEEIRKEREAAVEREKKMQEQMNILMATLAKSGHLPSLV